MSILDRLFGTKKAPPTAEPTQRPAVPAEESRRLLKNHCNSTVDLC